MCAVGHGPLGCGPAFSKTPTFQRLHGFIGSWSYRFLGFIMFKHAIGDDGLKVIKSFTYSERENTNDWHVVMGKMEKHCVGEVNEIYERYYFNERDKLPMETVDNFVAELKILAKTCNFCDC